MPTVVLSAYKVADFPNGGGHFWVYMQYALGLRLLGCDVYWLEQLGRARDPETERRVVATFLNRMKRFGMEGRVFLYARDGSAAGNGGSFRFAGCTAEQIEALLRRADLLLNFNYRIDPRWLALARRSALVDIDPGLLQYWISTDQLSVAAHDRYLTTGETVGTPGARFPDCGLPWIHIRPPVCLERWPFVHDPGCEAFTSVSSWTSSDWLKESKNGKTVLRENTKRVSFLEFAELPERTSQPLELALYLVDADADDRARLERHGWRIGRSQDLAGTPEDYQNYVQRSRGEFSCAKPSCMDFQNAWVSDRSLCYLASGKPVVVQDTGPSAVLPNGEGMFRFTTLDEAAAALEAVNRDYERHCRAARALAERCFDSKRVLEQALDAALD